MHQLSNEMVEQVSGGFGEFGIAGGVMGGLAGLTVVSPFIIMGAAMRPLGLGDCLDIGKVMGIAAIIGSVFGLALDEGLYLYNQNHEKQK